VRRELENCLVGLELDQIERQQVDEAISTMIDRAEYLRSRGHGAIIAALVLVLS
jgi:hypothetical protein